jgi:hypothetical protein
VTILRVEMAVVSARRDRNTGAFDAVRIDLVRSIASSIDASELLEPA